MKNCLRMDTIVSKHADIMDKYDPGKRVAMVVDEWGVWTDVEPGTNPGFLYQQNSLRDALIAGTTLNIFNNHADRVRMANLAQTVNVLQAIVLTKGSDMLLTPTYYVFDMYKNHMDAKLLPLNIQTPDYKNDDLGLPAVNASATIDSNGKVNITFVNIDANKDVTVKANLSGKNFRVVNGRVLTSKNFTDINTFEKKNTVVPKTFTNVKIQDNQLVVTLPKLSVVSLTLN